MEDEMQTEVAPEGSAFDTAAEKMKFERAVPGQSLTQDPDSPLPFEKPPEFTNYDQAQDYIFTKLMGNSSELVSSLAGGVSIEQLTEVILSTGYQQGKWSVDLLMLLVEPTMYILLFICEVSGVDYVFSDDDMKDMDTETMLKGESHIQKMIQKKGNTVEETVAAKGVEESAKEVLPPSLLAKAAEGLAGSQGEMV
jgi:hypothetical protein